MLALCSPLRSSYSCPTLVSCVYWGSLIVDTLVKVFSFIFSVFLSKKGRILLFFPSCNGNTETFHQNEKMVLKKKKAEYKWLLTHISRKMSICCKGHIRRFQFNSQLLWSLWLVSRQRRILTGIWKSIMNWREDNEQCCIQTLHTWVTFFQSDRDSMTKPKLIF